MDLTDHLYTIGMSEEEVTTRLQDAEAGVLSLATDGDAYAVPLSFFYDGTSVYFRLGDDGDASRKIASAESTDEACFVVYDVENGDESWSVVVRGPIRRVADPEGHGFDERTVRDRFGALRVFDEAVEDVEIVLFELDIRTITGRRTPN